MRNVFKSRKLVAVVGVCALGVSGGGIAMAASNSKPRVAASASSLGSLNLSPGVGVDVTCANPVTSTQIAGGVHVDCATSPPPPPVTTTTTVPPLPTTTTTPPPPPTTTTTIAPPPPPPAGSPSVRVQGNKLIDGAGNPITLRGANVSGTEFVCAQNWSDDAYGGAPLGSVATFNAMRAWNINAVRVPLNEDCWLGINGVRVGGAAYQAAIAKEVAAAHVAGMIVVLDLHWSAPGTQRALSQNPFPDLDHSPAFWNQVAGAYKSDPGVIFDLYNEPFDYWGTNPDHWAAWLNGGTQTQYETGGNPFTITANWQTAGMQQLVWEVRNAGALNPILVNGLDWSNDDSGWLAHVPSDPAGQLIAGAHIYPFQPCSDSVCWDKVYAGITAKYPLLIGETGDASTCAQDQAQCHWLTSSPPAKGTPFLPYAQAHGWSMLAWTWNPWGNGDDVLIIDWAGTPTSGQGVEWKNWLLGH